MAFGGPPIRRRGTISPHRFSGTSLTELVHASVAEEVLVADQAVFAIRARSLALRIKIWWRVCSEGDGTSRNVDAQTSNRIH